MESTRTKEETGHECSIAPQGNCLWFVIEPAKSNSGEIWNLRSPRPAQHPAYSPKQAACWPGRGDEQEKARNCCCHLLTVAVLASVSPPAKMSYGYITTQWNITT